MKKKCCTIIAYLIVLAVIDYVFPLLIRDTGSGMFLMLLVMPLLTLLNAVIYGIMQGFHPWIAVITAIFFVPAIFLFYNTSAWIYIVIYAVIALAGNGLGSAFHKPCTKERKVPQ